MMPSQRDYFDHSFIFLR
ncbi:MULTISPECIES: hypothetical protein [Shewanella]